MAPLLAFLKVLVLVGVLGMWFRKKYCKSYVITIAHIGTICGRDALSAVLLICSLQSFVNIFNIILALLSPQNKFISCIIHLNSNASELAPVLFALLLLFKEEFTNKAAPLLETKDEPAGQIDEEDSCEGTDSSDFSSKHDSLDEFLQQNQADYISQAAHDLYTPLQSFYLSLELLRQSSLTTAQIDILHQAYVALDLMKVTTRQAVDVQRLVGGFSLKPQKALTELSSVINRVDRIVRNKRPLFNLNFQVSPHVSPIVYTDEEWLWQMLTTVITHATRHSNSGDIQVTVSIVNEAHQQCVTCCPPDRSNQDNSFGKAPLSVNTTTSTHLVFTISSSNPDIPALEWPELVYSNETGLCVPPPAGSDEMGLFSVRARLTAMHGTCGTSMSDASFNTIALEHALKQVENVDKGMVAWFSLPYVPRVTYAETNSPTSVLDLKSPRLSQDDSGSPPASARSCDSVSTTSSEVNSVCGISSSSSPTAEDVQRARIQEANLVAILIEDTPTIRKLLHRTLLQMGFSQVHCYEDGQQGLEAMLSTQVDIVFSDVQMPLMCGDEMVRAFRTQEDFMLQSQIRCLKQLVVAVTANGAEFGDLLGAGFDAVYPKPVSKKTLFAVTEEYLNTKLPVVQANMS